MAAEVQWVRWTFGSVEYWETAQLVGCLNASFFSANVDHCATTVGDKGRLTFVETVRSKQSLMAEQIALTTSAWDGGTTAYVEGRSLMLGSMRSRTQTRLSSCQMTSISLEASMTLALQLVREATRRP